MTTKDLLIEIGTEELPASFVAGAMDAMPKIATELFRDARIDVDAIRALGTPRRLALLVSGVASAQRDVEEEVTGPPSRVAMGEDGKLTKAGEGFAKKQGVDPSALRVVTTDKGEYVAFTRSEKGRPAEEILPAVVSTLCARIPFAKSMRWGEGDVAFGRPVHWLLCLHGGEVVDTSFAGVRAGRTTRGHRFLAPQEIEIGKASDYVDALRAAFVLVDRQERRAKMHDALRAAAESLSGRLVPDEFLLDECTELVEMPFVVPGRFDETFLDLPERLIVSVMRDHQRYFAVSDRLEGTKLLPRYLNVVNTANAPEAIAKGNDRVLRARLSDARFFVNEDRKIPLGDRVPRLDKIVFQHELGTVGDKVRRVEALSASLTVGSDKDLARHAAHLAKADLVTLIVGEFPELQGEMGAFYAKEQGVTPRVADAIRDHYLPRGASDALPADVVAAAVAIADRADTLVGCFGIGLTPTGSADPFALRRAALGIVRIALDGPMDVDLRSLLGRAHGLYEKGVLADEAATVGALDDFFRARLKAYFASHATDVVEACLGAWDASSLRDLRTRIAVVDAFRAENPAYASLATAFKRAFNIAKDAPEGDVDASLLVEDAEKALAETFRALRPALGAHIASRHYGDALELVAKELKTPIDRFFENVFVMADDPKIRDNRLRLLKGIADTVTGIAHFHQLST
jgi:glycyl-tRNA synthetase beta chain